MRYASLLAIAVLASAGSIAVSPASPWQPPSPPRRRKPEVQRLAVETSEEIKAWNAAVEAKKKAKQGGQHD